jgi:ribonuclease HI
MYNDAQKELWGSEKQTTNQRMEMSAALEALRALKEPCNVRLYSDSAYLVNAFKRGWLERWQLNGWKTTKKEPVENQDLWQELLKLARRHNVRWIKVKGHGDNEYNNRCDFLAKKAIP